MDTGAGSPAEPEETDRQHYRADHGGSKECLHDVAESLLFMKPAEEHDESNVSRDRTETNADKC